MNTFNGQTFSAGDSITWQTNSNFISFRFESDVDIGFDQYGSNATITVPYIGQYGAHSQQRQGLFTRYGQFGAR